MNEVKVVGAAMTPFGVAPEASTRTLAESVATAALRDAGVSPSAVDLVVFGNATGGLLDGQEMVRGQFALRHSGLLGRPFLNVENACASSSSAFHVACLSVMAGTAEVALAVGAEKLSQVNKERTFAMLGGAVDLEEDEEVRRFVQAKVLGGLMSPEEAAATKISRSPFMDIYATRARAYAEGSGATPEDFAAVAVKNRTHAALNPKAQFTTKISVTEVLASRMIAEPLRLLMCSPIADGAAALVVTTPERARTLAGAAVSVAASAVRSSGGGERLDETAVQRAARAAYETAGVDPLDVDLAEVHDAAAPAELWTYEQLGFCGPGEGPKLLAEQEVCLGGRIPVNTSGGLLSKGHPVGATGCAQLVELVDQLRGRAGDRQVPGARIALAENGGGVLAGEEAAAVVTILST